MKDFITTTTIALLLFILMVFVQDFLESIRQHKSVFLCDSNHLLFMDFKTEENPKVYFWDRNLRHIESLPLHDEFIAGLKSTDLHQHYSYEWYSDLKNKNERYIHLIHSEGQASITSDFLYEEDRGDAKVFDINDSGIICI